MHTVLASQLCAATWLVPAALYLDGARAGLSALLWAVLAGMTSCACICLFYAALTCGIMGAAATVTATGSAIPVLVDFAAAGALPAYSALGIALIASGLVFALSASSGNSDPQYRRSLRLALAAAGAYGLTLVLLAEASSQTARGGHAVALLATMRVTSVCVLGLWLVACQPTSEWRQPQRHWLGLTVLGLIDAVATLTFISAVSSGRLAIVSVLASLSPLITFVLARYYAAERLRPREWSGLACAIVGIALIAGSPSG